MENINLDIISTIKNAYLSGQKLERTQIRPEILASWERSHHFNIDSGSLCLPPVSKRDINRGKSHVSGYTAHIRNSSSQYYQKEIALLSSANACLCYVSSNLDIYGRYGNQQLKDELKNRNLCLGANLSESRIGTNAVALCALTHSDIWCVGPEHYSEALCDYACFAFPIHSGYSKNFYVMLIVRVTDFDSSMISLFEFIKSCELIVSSGMTTSDMVLKNNLLEYNMSKNGTLLLMVNPEGNITYANDIFLKSFHMDIFQVINHPLATIIPSLTFALDCLKNGSQITTREILFSSLPSGKNRFFLDATSIHQNDICIGMVITMTQQQNVASLIRRVTNLNAKFTFDDLIGQHPDFIRIKKTAQKVAQSPSTVLIIGESGTGKELFAHSIHNESPRSGGPFISINCAAIPRELIGSELFGYVSGAFTGANKGGAQGKFELANGGTLFLDEIAEMPLDMQSVLLRVLEERSITRIGGNKAIPIDVRLITATNKDLQTYVKEGQFRLDLYYRLNVIQLSLIPLRDHAADIPLMANYFLSQISKNLNKAVTDIDSEALAILCNYTWPGNARELRNVIERGINLSTGSTLTAADLPPYLASTVSASKTAPLPSTNTFSNLDKIQNAHKVELVNQLMEKYHGNKSLVAKELGIARTTLYRLLSKINEEGSC